MAASLDVSGSQCALGEADGSMSPSTPPVTVSIVMAAYNAASTIKESIRSVLAQSFTDWELIVVDDGSTDGTGEIAEEFGDSRIRLITISRSGVVGARNLGISLSRAPLIAILDSDDLMTPQRLRLQIEVARLRPDVGVHAGWFRDLETSKLGVSPLSGPAIKKFLQHGSSVCHSTVMFNTSALTYLPQYPQGLEVEGGEIAGAEDYALLWNLAQSGGRFLTLPVVLCRYRAPTSLEVTQRRRELARAHRQRAFDDSKRGPTSLPVGCVVAKDWHPQRRRATFQKVAVAVMHTRHEIGALSVAARVMHRGVSNLPRT